MKISTKKEVGFTLLELLIAFFIFTIIAIITTVGFRLVINSTQQTSQLTQRIAKLQSAFFILERDFQQTVDRKITDESNQSRPSFLATEEYVEFTHLGAINPALAHNTPIERVQYRWDKNQHQLLRITWQVLDRVPSSKAMSEPILKNIKQLNWQFYDDKLKTYSSWPSTQQTSNTLPTAIQIEVTLENQGTLTRLIKISGGSFD